MDNISIWLHNAPNDRHIVLYSWDCVLMSDKKRNPIAKSLRSPHLKQQVIPDKRRDLLDSAIQMDLEDYIDSLDDVKTPEVGKGT